MNPIRRFLNWRRDLLTPEHVEKASRRERWKRNAWMFVCTIGTLLSVGATVGTVAVELLHPAVAFASTFIVWLYVDHRVATWGIEYFDIVRPWQFRDAEVEERETA